MARIELSTSVVWALGFLAFLNLYPMQAVLPLLMHEFAADAVQAGATVGATVLAIALLSPLVGVLSDATGRRGWIVGALGAQAALTMAIPFAPGLDAIVAMRFLQGMAIPGVTAVLTAYLAEEYEGNELSRLMAAYISGGVFGGFSGRFVVGYVSDFFDWRSAFFVLAALSLLGAVFVRYRLPQSRHFAVRRDAARSLQQLLAHLRNRQLLSACLSGFCILFCLVGGLTYLMVFLSAAPYSLSSRDLGNLFLVYLVGVLVTPLSARAMSRYGLRRVLMLAFGGAACGLSLTFLSSLPLIVAGMTLFSSGIFCAQAVAIRRVAEVVKEGRSLASGLYGSCYYAGGAAGAWLCAWAYVRVGWSGAGGVVFIVLAVAVAGALVGWKPHSPSH